jgi:hypothetical protein
MAKIWWLQLTDLPVGNSEHKEWRAVTNMSPIVGVALITATAFSTGCGREKYSVRVGVLEDRQPSRNSLVFLVPADATDTIDAVFKSHLTIVANLEAGMNHELESRKVVESRLASKPINTWNDKNLAIVIEHRRTSDQLTVKEHDLKLEELRLQLIESHRQFIANLTESLISVTERQASTGMDGTADFDNLPSLHYAYYVIPASPDQFHPGVTKVNDEDSREVIVELARTNF